MLFIMVQSNIKYSLIELNKISINDKMLNFLFKDLGRKNIILFTVRTT